MSQHNETRQAARTRKAKASVLYMHGTGHVQGLRARLRDRPDARESVECERMLDAIIERAVDIALEQR